MFSNPVNIDRSIEEGTVVQVDPQRSLCKVLTIRGETHQSVQWLTSYGGSSRAGERFTPTVGDRALMSYGMGFPVILGFLPKMQLQEGSSPLTIGSGEATPDTGNYSPGGEFVVGDQNRPRDFVHGDKTFSSDGGGFLGILRGGTVVLRSSRAAELLLSKFQRLARIVASNWELFTDLSSEVIQNYKGRVYKYSGYAKTFLDAKIEKYNLHFYHGDVAAAESVKTGYHGAVEAAVATEVIYKEQITDYPEGPARELMRRTLKISGEEESWITNDTHFTRRLSTPETLRQTWNDQNVIVITESSIHVFHKDGADLILDASGIRATFQGGEVNMSGGSIDVNFSGTDVNLSSGSATITRGASTGTFTDSSITLASGAGTALVSAGTTQIVNGGHSVTVTAGGVAIV